MGRCGVCGNEYDKATETRHQGRTGTFGAFECAIHALTPTCAGRGFRVVGHGVEADAGRTFCGASWARAAGVGQFRGTIKRTRNQRKKG